MKILKKITVLVCTILLTCVFFSMTVMAGGPPLKENACGGCHKDFKSIIPKGHPDVGGGAAMACTTCHPQDPDRSEATKFSTLVHKIHKNGKAKQECAACHAL